MEVVPKLVNYKVEGSCVWTVYAIDIKMGVTPERTWVRESKALERVESNLQLLEDPLVDFISINYSIEDT